MIVAGALKGAGSYQSGQAQADLYSGNEDVARFRAKDVMRVAQLDTRRYQQGISRLLGSQRAGYASQGVALDTGSPVAVAADTMEQADIDEQIIMLNAIRERWGLLVQARDFSQAAKNAKTSGTAGAFGSILSGVAGGL